MVSTDKKSEEKVVQSEQNYVKDNKIGNQKSYNIGSLNVNTKEISIVNSDTEENKGNINDITLSCKLKNNIPVMLDIKDCNIKNKEKKKDNYFEMTEEDEDISSFNEGEYKLSQGERVIQSLSFE